MHGANMKIFGVKVETNILYLRDTHFKFQPLDKYSTRHKIRHSSKVLEL